MEDVVKYTVRALGCGHVINKQLHIRPRLNQVSQHDLIHIYEDKLFRQQGIGKRLVRAPISAADLDAQIAGDLRSTPSCLGSLEGQRRNLAALGQVSQASSDHLNESPINQRVHCRVCALATTHTLLLALTALC